LRRAVREKLGVRAAIQRKVGAVPHAYSHYRITLHGYICTAAGGRFPSGEGTGWLRPGSRDRYAIPRADRKILDLIPEEETS